MRDFKRGDKVKVKKGARWVPGKVERVVEGSGRLFIEVQTEQWGLKLGEPGVSVRHVHGATYDKIKVREILRGKRG